MSVTADDVFNALNQQAIVELDKDGEHDELYTVRGALDLEEVATFINQNGESAVGNPVHVELPGTEATMLYDEDAHALYVTLRADPSGVTETQTVVGEDGKGPIINVDIRDGEAVGIEILLSSKAESK